MTYPESVTELSFEPPGPGSWAQDPVHFPRPVTRYWAEMHPEPFARGPHEFARYYGLLIAGLTVAYVNGLRITRRRRSPTRNSHSERRGRVRCSSASCGATRE